MKQDNDIHTIVSTTIIYSRKFRSPFWTNLLNPPIADTPMVIENYNN